MARDDQPDKSAGPTPLDLLKSLFLPPDNGGVVQSDAPGTSERLIKHEGQDRNTSVDPNIWSPPTPDPWHNKRVSGPGPSGLLGYAQHGDPVRIARPLTEMTRLRYPDLATHGRPGPMPPEYNQLYSILKDDEDYDKIILGTASGTWTVGTTTSQAVTLNPPAAAQGGSPLPLTALFNQFPGSIQVYPVLLLFSFSQSVLTATGQYSMAFVPQGGDIQYPLGEYNAGKGDAQNYMRHIIRAPFTDPGQVNMGTLIITSIGVVGTPSIAWRMGFGFAAFIPAPAFRTSEPLHTREWIASAPEPDTQATPAMAPGQGGRRG